MVVRDLLRGTVFASLFVSPAMTYAGMPTLTLSQNAQERISIISFFLLVIVVSTVVIYIAWNSMRKDIAWLPKIGFRSAAGIACLWGLLSIVVLTMISGARELMTPGAWERNGLTYRLANESTSKNGTQSQSQQLQLWHDQQHLERKTKLIAVQSELLSYAIQHQGNFPENSSEIDEKHWQLPAEIGGNYLYYPGATLGQHDTIIVIEPQVAERQFVLFADGAVAELLPEQIARIDQP